MYRNETSHSCCRRFKWASARVHGSTVYPEVHAKKNSTNLIVMVVYHNDCRKKIFTVLPASRFAVGRPRDDQVDRSMEKIFQRMENSDDCQFSFEEFVKALTDEMYYIPHTKTIKERLVVKYGDDVMISINQRNQPIVCFHHTGEKLLTKAWYSQWLYSSEEADKEERFS